MDRTGVRGTRGTHRPIAAGMRKAVRSEASTAPASTDRGLWKIRSLEAARQILRARNQTIQAGFTAEKIPQSLFRARPILIADGSAHDGQRREVARFFAPAVIADRYGDRIEAAAQRIRDEAVVTGHCRLEDAALHFTVDVTAEVVGLTDSDIDKMASRLVAFFRQPPVDPSADNWGRTNRQWLRAAVNGLVPILRFFAHDVRPAIRSHRRQHRGDVISHLLDTGHSTADILVECMTYGTAGMITTREFIAMACWHLLDDDQLKQEYLDAERPQRLSILEEIIRLEPVVGHLYRRTVSPVEISVDDEDVTIPTGDLIDICVRSTNVDERSFGTDAEALCPHRAPASVGLSFSDGAHRCPGQPLALFETDALLHAILSCGPRLISRPTIEWDSLIASYRIRNVALSFTAPARPDRRQRGEARRPVHNTSAMTLRRR